MSDNTKHLSRHYSQVSMQQRRPGRVIWLTGLSGAGKSSLAYALEAALCGTGQHCVVLDGDNLRHGLCVDLDFSSIGRRENLRRAAHVARLLSDSGAVCIAAFISPLKADREMVREIVGAHYHEVYLRCGLEVCEARDVKGLYRRARAGEIKDFTGISSAYEPPPKPDLVLDTAELPLQRCVQLLLEFLLHTASATQPWASEKNAQALYRVDVVT